ncbi:MFS transporter [Sphingomonas radiodurans]|uniref:permease n=1 Tax=Sphingomonas radiodurans TaxID=2890321 RepID=UPI001E45382E|nr:permease [Sphingomonas radiodurans]WBH17399.1 permease [Sphingomonas radiodurans]
MHAPAPPTTHPPSRTASLALFGLLGFASGLPFFMFTTVLALRLQAHGVGVVVIGFFAWIALLPTMKFLWAPLLDRLSVPGFARFWGQRRGWLMLAQLGIAASLAAMAFTSDDRSLPLTALLATSLAFWTTTLEVAADAWRIILYPGKAAQGPVVAASVWGYRTAMVAAGSGALIVADGQGWTAAYLLIALAALAPFPLLAAMAPEPNARGGRTTALITGIATSIAILLGVALAIAAIGWLLLAAAGALGIGAGSNVTPVVLGLCLIPFVALAIALPYIRRAPADAPIRRSAVTGPYVDIFWRYGTGVLALLAFVSLYRMGDVLALTLAKPLVASLGYSLRAIGIADGAVALGASMLGVAAGGLMAARAPLGRTLALGAILAALGNWGFVWLAHRPPASLALYLATFADQFGNGFAGAAFVVYLSLPVNPRHPGAQYALLSGFAFLLPRLLGGASGSIVAQHGYDRFFLLSGALSLAALPLLPIVVRLRPRPEDA